jgi:type IV pilus assembly protein PilY1
MEQTMKTPSRTRRWAGRLSGAAAVVALAATNLALVSYAPAAHAEDIDIFTINPTITALRPNVLFFVDNTANWNTAFANEKSALVTTVNGLDDRFNVGWGGFVETGNPNDNTDGAYIRAGVRQMTTTNKAALAAMVNNLDIGLDKGNNATYGTAMAEMYRYFGGLDSVSGHGKRKRDFNGNTMPFAGNSANDHPGLAFSNAVWALQPGNPFLTSTTRTYTSPISDACQKNFIVFISNGPANDNAASTNAATSALSGYGGSTEQITISPNGSQSNVADEWASFMANTDVETTRPGVQNIVTYTIDINPGTQKAGRDHTALLKSMADKGKGRYFAVSTANGSADLVAALEDIMKEVLAVNSVFAASALPASVNARGTFLNQVYMGMFRPDPQANPRWAGNLKQYKLGESNGRVRLVDNSSPAIAIENQITGFINDNVRSFWTQDSTFWNASTYPAITAASDAPDGPLVEKGGAAFRLRTVHATDVTTRKLYTCTGACTGGSALSVSPFDTTNAALTAAALGDAALDKDEVIRWVRGENRKLDDNPVDVTTKTRVRGYLHGDVLHSKPAIVNYNRTPGNRDIWVFYGANDGVLHAVKGGQDNGDGYEEWGFVAPEFFDRFSRLYNNSPIIEGAAKKPYFFDGPMSVWTHDADGNGSIESGDKVILFASARRGGRLVYAFDITNPTSPIFLWKITNSSAGFGELGYTFGEVRVAKVRGQTNPVALISAGYDQTANDVIPRGTATMGRGVFMVDAITGTPIFHASGAVATGSSTLNVPGMDFAIAADPVVIDTNADGVADRIYLADTAANIWRINIDTAGSNLPSTWAAAKVAALGGSGADERKFMQAPDVVPFDNNYDAILIGSGDRENPLDVTIQNHFFMVKDAHAVNALPVTPLVMADLYDATTTYAVPATAMGWHFGLRTGEKVVTGATTLNGATFFSTNRPESTLPVGTSCTAGLGEARDYVVNFRTSGPVTDFNVSGTLTVEDRSEVRAGGGLPPSPIGVTVCDGLSKCAEVVLSGSKTSIPPGITLGRRYRSFWNTLTERR